MKKNVTVVEFTPTLFPFLKKLKKKKRKTDLMGCFYPIKSVIIYLHRKKYIIKDKL